MLLPPLVEHASAAVAKTTAVARAAETRRYESVISYLVPAMILPISCSPGLLMTK